MISSEPEHPDPSWDIVEPNADSLVESLRAFGYSPESAIADLIDNSLSAGAHLIDVRFDWQGRESVVSISDDGRGMDEDGLRNAMRPGSRNPLSYRAEHDLGRFGLGLKTASFSQARELTVFSSLAGGVETFVRRWDLDEIGRTNQWRLQRSAPIGHAIPSLARADSGTTVLWTKCDRLVGEVEVSDSQAHRRFLEIIDRVREHLALTFHRFMVGRGKVTIRVNDTTVEPLDPYLTHHPATMGLAVERLPLAGRIVVVEPHVVPHRSKLSEAELRSASNAAGFNALQGFFVYRARRLLLAGDWLSLGFTKDEHTKLARIRIDFPAELDHEWQIDVRKASARPPRALIPDLRRIALATRRSAEEVYRHRGKVILQRTSRDFVASWQEIKLRDGTRAYRINRKHPVLLEALTTSTVERRRLERVLRFVEETVPTTLIGVGIADALDNQRPPYADAAGELVDMGQYLFEQLTAVGTMTSVEALERIACAEPFVALPEIVEAIRERCQPRD